MAPSRTFGFAAAGAALAQFLPGLVMESQMVNSHASWGWSFKPPKCIAPIGGEIYYEGSADIAAGADGKVKCNCKGGTPSKTSVPCPSSKSGNSPTSPDNGWYDLCGSGPSCKKDMTIGADVTCSGCIVEKEPETVLSSGSIHTASASGAVMLVAAAGAVFA
eukprot:TRINITY_DN403_c0_g1_i1.p1 TRINITY_DN403_c0_g1~~TRINITY_DN403_c0_g1_i1.p1  ORF type:complete len:162 (+),score=50.70 TRINITY_DN403_c0_g1_i1:205-690(+)